MFIVTYRKVFFALTGLLVLASLASIFIFGLKLGTDFTGGTLAEVRYSAERPDVATLTQSLDTAGFSGFSLRESQNNSYVMRAGNLSQDARAKLADAFSVAGKYPSSI